MKKMDPFPDRGLVNSRSGNGQFPIGKWSLFDDFHKLSVEVEILKIGQDLTELEVNATMKYWKI
jgi:hypothetical protein